MIQEQKLSLPAVILININIMLGAGIFINSVELAKRSGALGGFTYLLIGLLSFPLVLSIAKLLDKHPGGNFYTFGSQEINKLAGFVATWSYFIGKLASAILMTHTATLLLQYLIPPLSMYPSYSIDILILSLFTILNLLNMKTGKRIQAMFLGLKIIPIVFVIATGFFLFDPVHFTTTHFVWSGVPESLPLVLYAATGFEATCSLSSKLKNPERDGSRAVIFSYLAVIIIGFLYQSLFYGSLGGILAAQKSYLTAFPMLLAKFFGNTTTARAFMGHILHSAFAASALGGAYGILFSNNWNLYRLAQQGHTFFGKQLQKLNNNGIPMLCTLAEGAVCLFFLATVGENQAALQQMGSLGCTIAYAICALALLKAQQHKSLKQKLLPLLGLGTSFIYALAFINSFLIAGFKTISMFIILFVFGLWMFFNSKK